ncbi:2-oxo acid dehydrogenase subunit E2 [Calidifontibacter sp. DB0510]|uniref:Dihydrolipoamide acetyltransferase component of pyruvate dehydrogenase complex n=1 Tax=Metallococcus carri TaxID=1656884 RepID=A0A967B8F4_9MICO|nr:dihydrolipoamide acetyltransferase family protein [Metallococcus carri]NHN56696.1 2-oxo acid dehydrogenase subunit E2 [Metallococcus carri]NOP37927.1 2-oxo acid dehydrogenase subunit E2 [Calidifontibacter sp. DB2511S]
MAAKKFNLPDPGEGLVEAEIVTWKIKPGDTVTVNQIVVEIETAKSLVELPIPWAGTVGELLVNEGDTVEVGAPIVTIEVEGAADEPAPAAPAADGEEAPATLVGYGAKETSSRRRARKGGASAGGAADVYAGGAAGVSADVRQGSRGSADAGVGASGVSADVQQGSRGSADAGVGASGVSADVQQGSRASADAGAAAAATPASVAPVAKPLAKPPVRKFAKDHGVDLAAVTPSSPDGIISRADVEAHLAEAGARGDADAGAGAGALTAPAAARDGVAQASGPAYGMSSPTGERETRIPIKGVRKMTAQAMVGSAFTAPHVTEFVTVDMTRTMELLERLKTDREFKGIKVTPLLVLAKALCVAVRRNPGVNATWDEQAQEIVVKHYVNLGIAASTPRGLIVPNIKDADRMSLRELGEALNALVDTAREGRTPPADMSGGSITITNVGVFGVDNGTPIINPGESAILCFGAIRKMPWVVEGPDGDQIVPRQVTQLSLSFDHRLVDGDLGSRFLADIAALLEDPARALVWG